MKHDSLLTAPLFYQEPHHALHQLRAHAPVFWSDGWGVWVLTRYDDVVAVLKNHADFVNFGRVTHLIKQLPDEIAEAKAALLFHYETGLAHTDPPIHSRLRGLLNRAFTPRMVAQWRIRIEGVVDQLIDDLKQQGDFDLLPTFAYPLPATIIGDMLGVPARDIHLFQGWALAINQLFEKGGRISINSAVNAYNNLRHMRAYIADMVAKRRKRPTDDVIGNLVQIEATGERLTLDELVSTVVTFFVAGHDTTTNLIANGVYLFMQQPEIVAELVEQPQLMKTAVEEILRLEPSVPRMWRLAARDYPLGEQTIRTGQMVFPMLSAANRDPTYFPNPDSFSLTRKNMKNVAFGFGIHYCIGAPLARLEGEIALRKLITAFPKMQLAETPRWSEDIAIRRLETLRLKRHT
ncbi:MAG: cytochrome P450 [Chloroflexota bacterium]